MKVSTHAGLLYLDFAGAERFRGPDDGVVDRLVEICHVMRVESNLRSEELRVKNGIFGARASIEPTEIAKRERRKVIGGGSGFGRLQGLRNPRSGACDRCRWRWSRA